MANYNTIRLTVGLAAISSMNDRPKEITDEAWGILKTLYKRPDDIDLFTGGLGEIPEGGKCVHG